MGVLATQVSKRNSQFAAHAVCKSLAKRLPAEMQPKVTVVAAIYNVEHGGVDTLVRVRVCQSISAF